MQKFIVDTSVAAKLFLENEEHKELAITLFVLANQEKIDLYAPSLIFYELNNCLIKYGVSAVETKTHLCTFWSQVKNKIIKIIPPGIQLLNKTADIATTDTQGKGHISAYDSTFHAVALLKGAIYVTADKNHYNKTNNCIGSVLLLENWNYYFKKLPVGTPEVKSL